MILTVTLNPLLEKRLSYPSVVPGSNHRNGKSETQAGGKGINVSRQLNYFGIDSLAYTFIGGTNGKIFNEAVHTDNIKLAAVRTKAESRSAAIIVDEQNSKVSTFFEPSAQISSAEANEFLVRLEKMIPNCEIVVLSGSSPCDATDHIFPAAIEIANRLDKVSVCDTYGNHLSACLAAAPMIIHNNLNELTSSLSINLNEEKEKIDFLNFLYTKGIKQAYLTDGESPVYCSNFDYHYKVSNPKVNVLDSTGSGDAFVAGILYGWEKDFTFEESLSFAVSCGALNAASYQTCRVKLNDIESIRKDVVISPVGKKMKIVDVTPR